MTNILQLFVISGNFEFLGKNSILLYVFWIVFDGFVQHIPLQEVTDHMGNILKIWLDNQLPDYVMIMTSVSMSR